MKILVFSDTHGFINSAADIIAAAPELEAVIHAGDCERDVRALEREFPDIPIYAALGNNDFFSASPYDIFPVIGGKRIFVTHGHNYRVKWEHDTYTSLKAKARAVKADLCIFGHTHTPYLDTDGTLTILNPGSITFGGTYAVVDITGGKIRADIKRA